MFCEAESYCLDRPILMLLFFFLNCGQAWIKLGIELWSTQEEKQVSYSQSHVLFQIYTYKYLSLIKQNFRSLGYIVWLKIINCTWSKWLPFTHFATLPTSPLPALPFQLVLFPCLVSSSFHAHSPSMAFDSQVLKESGLGQWRFVQRTWLLLGSCAYLWWLAPLRDSHWQFYTTIWTFSSLFFLRTKILKTKC